MVLLECSQSMLDRGNEGIKALVRENLALSRENHQLLRKLYNQARIARAVKLLYWLVIIGSALGAYYYLQPYLATAMSAYQKANSILENPRSLLPGSGIDKAVE